MAKVKDFVYDKGSTFILRLTWKDKNGPIDITGYHLRMQLKVDYNGDALVTLDSAEDDGTIEFIDSEAGKFQIRMDDDLVQAVVHEELLYDLFAVSPEPDLIKTKLMQGKIELRPQVTTFDE